MGEGKDHTTKKLKGRGESIIFQAALMFVICILLTGGIVYASQFIRSSRSVTTAMENHARFIGEDVKRSIVEYPAAEWLFSYWYDHADDLDIDYDEGFEKGTRTEEKCRILAERHPELQLRYADAEEIKALPEEDQKLYAEIIYSWMISDMDQIKESFDINYLFCVETEDSLDTQFFIFSAARRDEKRGTEGTEVYPLGMVKTLNQVQSDSMKDALLNSSHFAYSDGYIHYYLLLGEVDGRSVFIGLTFTETELVKEVLSETANGSVAAMGYQVILAVICLLGIFFLALRPLRVIQKSICRYMEDKDSAAVASALEKVRSHNEIGELSGDITALAREIDEYVDEIQKITADKERIETELALAEQIQTSVLPKEFPPFPDRHEFDIYASMDPAREVGGDFYDFFLIDDDHLCLVMADVSGKGIPGALFMMISKTIIAYSAYTYGSPAMALGEANEALIANNDAEMFVTVWIGILEISTGKMTAANAGHEYPALRKPDGQYELLKDKHGFVLAGMEGAGYKDYEIQLEPGSSIFLYTDGVPEATDADNELFGTDRMLEALNSDPDADPEKVLQNVHEHTDAFVGDAEPFDDMTMLCMRYNGGEK